MRLAPDDEAVDEAIEQLELRLAAFRKMRGGTRRWRKEDIHYTEVLLDYARERRNRQGRYQGYDVGTSRIKVMQDFIARYGRGPSEIIFKGGVVLAGPITKEEKERS